MHLVSATGADVHQLLEHDLVDVATVSAIYTQGAAAAWEIFLQALQRHQRLIGLAGCAGAGELLEHTPPTSRASSPCATAQASSAPPARPGKQGRGVMSTSWAATREERLQALAYSRCSEQVALTAVPVQLKTIGVPGNLVLGPPEACEI